MSFQYALLILSFVYNGMILAIFFTRERVKNFETRIYSALLISNVIGIILETACVVCGYAGVVSSFSIMYVKFYMLYILTWITLFTTYVIYIASTSKKNKKEISKSKKITRLSMVLIIYLVLGILVWMLPLYLYSDGIVSYTYGPSSDLLSMVHMITVISDVIAVLAHFKSIPTKKKIPIFILVLATALIVVVKTIDPGIQIIGMSFVFITVLMYFTIENPDKKIIDQLEDARSQADKANRAKTDFLSSMSHEIRTPLNAIVGFSECIVDADSLESAKEDAKDIVMASNNLLEIVNGILDISKIEADKMEIVNTEYNLNEILENLTKLIKPRIGEKPIELETQFAPDIPNNLYGDAGKVKQIITNILTNAAKYTEEGMINFKVNCVNVGNTCKLVISISDTGRGIKESQMAKLFTKFERLDEDRNTTTEGTGLGLAITKRLVEMMGGKIVVQSEYGEGSTFTVYLKQEIRNSSKKEEKEVIKEVDVSGNRVLAVDDNKLNLKVIKKLLGDYNLDITLVESGFICLDKVKEEKYDLILMDIMMPKMGGLETLKRLKEIDGFSTPVVALTADAIQGKSDKYKEVGFNDYLAKPIDRDELKRVLYTYLKPNKNNDNPIKEEKVIEKKDNMDYKDNINNINYLREKGIDVDSSIELLGDIDMYNSTLKDFIEESKSRVPKMKEFKNNGDCANYAILAHAMKSDSKYLGFKTLATLSLDHELKGKDNDIDFINANYDTLIQELNRVLCIVKNYLGE